jgi:subtilisin-like proprotein convertase family protein
MTQRSTVISLLFGLCVVLFVSACASATGTAPTTRTFQNTTPIAVPGEGTSGPAAPYPSVISVVDMPTTVTAVTVTLSAISHTWPADIDVLLVGPAGQHTLLMSDAGGGTNILNVTLTFDQSAEDSLPSSGPIMSGTYLPTNFGDGDIFAAPAPGGPYDVSLDVFDGTNPNGTWSLYVVDDAGGDVGTIGGGWSLTVTSR